MLFFGQQRRQWMLDAQGQITGNHQTVDDQLMPHVVVGGVVLGCRRGGTQWPHFGWWWHVLVQMVLQSIKRFFGIHRYLYRMVPSSTVQLPSFSRGTHFRGRGGCLFLRFGCLHGHHVFQMMGTQQQQFLAQCLNIFTDHQQSMRGRRSTVA